MGELEQQPWLELTLFVVQGVALSLLCEQLVLRYRHGDDELINLKERQAILERVCSGAGEGITLRDARGKLLYANEMAAELVGFESASQLLAIEPRALRQRFELVQTNGEPFPVERLPSNIAFSTGSTREAVMGFRLVNDESRKLRWVRVRPNPSRNKHGRVGAVVTLFRDVTQERQQEEALLLAQEWFQSALRSIADAVVTTDSAGTVNMLNPVAERTLGISSKQAVGRPVTALFRIISEATRQTLDNPVSRVLKDHAVSGLPGDALLVLPDERELAVEISAAPIHSQTGDVRGVILVFRDVSDKRSRERQQELLARATVELNSSLDYHRTLATVARVVVPLMADWCAVDIWEAGTLRRLAVAHVDPEKIRHVEEIQRKYPPDPDAGSGAYNILRTGQAEILPLIPKEVLERAARDAEHLEAIRALNLRSYMGVPMLREGKAFGVITFAFAESNRRYDESDLALAQALADRASVSVEHARLMAQAEEARIAAVRADRTKSDFLAMLGHELRNPLAPILTALELMRSDTRVAQGTEYEIIERQLKHVVQLVDDLLDISRITHGKVELSQQNVPLCEVIERAHEMVSLGGAVRQHDIRISVSNDLMVYGDPTRLAQIFSKLLINACKYTKAGGKIWIDAHERDDYVVVEVGDDGIGIEAEMLPWVFETFVQEPQALDRSRGGLGLGLSIVHGLVSAHGGRVKAFSEGPGKGALHGLAELPIAAITGYGQGEDEQKSREAGFVAHLVKPVDMGEIGQLLSSLNSCVSQVTGSHIR